MRFRIFALFVVHALAIGAVLTRIPDLQQLYGLSQAQLGLILMGQPLGALPMFLVSSRLIEKFGPRQITLWFMPVLIISAGLAGVIAHPFSLFLALVLHGCALSLTNVAINVEGDRFEYATGHRILNTCHGIWSVGFLLTAVFGAAMRGGGVSPTVHLGLLVPILIGLLLLAVLPMPQSVARPYFGSTRGKLALPTLATIGLVAFGLGAGVTEGASRAWGIIYLRDNFVMPEWAQSMALPLLMGSMAVGRLCGDRMLDRLGPKRTALTLSVTALLGLMLLIFPPAGWLALGSFTLIGLGISLLNPMMLSAAAQLGDRPASQNVAAVTVVFQLVNLAAPVLFGLIAQGLGIQMAFMGLIPLILLSLIMSGKIRFGNNASLEKS